MYSCSVVAGSLQVLLLLCILFDSPCRVNSQFFASALEQLPDSSLPLYYNTTNKPDRKLRTEHNNTKYRLYTLPKVDSSLRCRKSGICDGNYSCAPDGLGCIRSAEGRRRKVVEAMKWSWEAYRRSAWGYDELRPWSEEPNTWFDLGLTIVDSLDTLLIMGLRKEYMQARRWIMRLNFNKPTTVSVFEVTIRILGGLMAAYYQTQDHMYLDLSNQLAKKLMTAFDVSTGMPSGEVSFREKTWTNYYLGGSTNLAELGSLSLEFGATSRATGLKAYENAVMGILEGMNTMFDHDGLLCQNVYVRSDGPECGDQFFSMGASSDSAYEYLLKHWIITGFQCQVCRDMYVKAMRGMRKWLLRRIPNEQCGDMYFVGDLSRHADYRAWAAARRNGPPPPPYASLSLNTGTDVESDSMEGMMGLNMDGSVKTMQPQLPLRLQGAWAGSIAGQRNTSRINTTAGGVTNKSDPVANVAFVPGGVVSDDDSAADRITDVGVAAGGVVSDDDSAADRTTDVGVAAGGVVSDGDSAADRTTDVGVAAGGVVVGGTVSANKAEDAVLATRAGLEQERLKDKTVLDLDKTSAGGSGATQADATKQLEAGATGAGVEPSNAGVSVEKQAEGSAGLTAGSGENRVAGRAGGASKSDADDEDAAQERDATSEEVEGSDGDVADTVVSEKDQAVGSTVVLKPVRAERESTQGVPNGDEVTTTAKDAAQSNAGEAGMYRDADEEDDDIQSIAASSEGKRNGKLDSEGDPAGAPGRKQTKSEKKMLSKSTDGSGKPATDTSYAPELEQELEVVYDDDKAGGDDRGSKDSAAVTRRRTLLGHGTILEPAAVHRTAQKPTPLDPGSTDAQPDWRADMGHTAATGLLANGRRRLQQWVSAVTDFRTILSKGTDPEHVAAAAEAISRLHDSAVQPRDLSQGTGAGEEGGQRATGSHFLGASPGSNRMGAEGQGAGSGTLNGTGEGSRQRASTQTGAVWSRRSGMNLGEGDKPLVLRLSGNKAIADGNLDGGSAVGEEVTTDDDEFLGMAGVGARREFDTRSSIGKITYEMRASPPPPPVGRRNTKQKDPIGDMPAAYNNEDRMHHLACFVPGMLALGHMWGLNTAEHPDREDDDLLLAARLMRTCYNMYLGSGTGVGVEELSFSGGESPLPPPERHYLGKTPPTKKSTDATKAHSSQSDSNTETPDSSKTDTSQLGKSTRLNTPRKEGGVHTSVKSGSSRRASKRTSSSRSVDMQPQTSVPQNAQQSAVSSSNSAATTGVKANAAKQTTAGQPSEATRQLKGFVTKYKVLQDVKRAKLESSGVLSNTTECFAASDDMSILASTRGNNLRPEFVESLMLMYRATGDPIYQEWGWNIFRAFEKYSKMPNGGYNVLLDSVEVPPLPGDKMESFWTAETLKYFYLLFSPPDVVPLQDYVFNTEAHPLAIWGGAGEPPLKGAHRHGRLFTMPGSTKSGESKGTAATGTNT